MSTLAATNLKHASSASNNIVLDSSGNTSVSGAITVTGAATFNGTLVPASSFLRNRIINGDMRIDQRNAGAATANTINSYTVDRWAVFQSVTGKLIAQQNAGSVTPPAGFTNYLGVTSQSAYSVGSSDYYVIDQRIEGFNISDLAWGTANAKSIIISFWVRSSLTGTFGGSLRNASENRSYPFTYSISSANTWEQKTVSIAGDTSGTWGTGNGIGIEILFGLGVGSTYSGTAGAWASANYIGGATGATSVVGTNGATFYITGVQLEVGTAATPFERRQYGQELALCQRYYSKSYNLSTVPGTSSTGGYAALPGLAGGTGNTRTNIRFAVDMRTAPTLSYWDLAGNASKSSSFASNNAQTDNISSASFSLANISTSGFTFNDAGGAGSAGAGAWASAVHWVASAEL